MYKAENFIKDITREPSKQYKIGTIINTSGSDRPFVKIDGESEGKNIGVPYLQSYTPVEGDRVLMADYNGYIILGKIV